MRKKASIIFASKNALGTWAIHSLVPRGNWILWENKEHYQWGQNYVIQETKMCLRCNISLGSNSGDKTVFMGDIILFFSKMARFSKSAVKHFVTGSNMMDMSCTGSLGLLKKT